MPDFFITDTEEPSIPIKLIAAGDLAAWLDGQGDMTRRWAAAAEFTAAKDQILLVPGGDGGIACVAFGVGDGMAPEGDPWAFARLSGDVPPGTYRIADHMTPAAAYLAALGWGLHQYRFTRYKTGNTGNGHTGGTTNGDGGNGNPARRLVAPGGVDLRRLNRVMRGAFMVRDLINTPTNDMGPDELEQAVRDVAAGFGADVQCVAGDALLDDNFPLIHAVGRASDRAPRLVDMTWGPVDAPRLTLVGKGVCFDTGGLDIKPSAGMRLMKKDMGGAAHALALAWMIMDAGLPVRLRLLIPAVENNISANAFRPGDVIRSRSGIAVEIDNTDAEGRLVLADALALAGEDEPDLLIDFATLTGAARIALGADIPPFFTDSHDLAQKLADLSVGEAEPVWRLPLWMPYMDELKSKVGDMVNSAPTGFGGAITAALFLKRFVKDATRWVHFDVFGWNKSDRPGRPAGGEAMALRTVYRLIEKRYG